MHDPIETELRKQASVIYIAVPEEVAKDLSRMFLEAADYIRDLKDAGDKLIFALDSTVADNLWLKAHMMQGVELAMEDMGSANADAWTNWRIAARQMCGEDD